MVIGDVSWLIKSSKAISDIEILIATTGQHQVYELRTCIDTSNVFKGIQMTLAVFSNDGIANEKVKLTAFGDLKPPYCKVYTFKKDEVIESM